MGAAICINEHSVSLKDVLDHERQLLFFGETPQSSQSVNLTKRKNFMPNLHHLKKYNSYDDIFSSIPPPTPSLPLYEKSDFVIFEESLLYCWKVSPNLQTFPRSPSIDPIKFLNPSETFSNKDSIVSLFFWTILTRTGRVASKNPSLPNLIYLMDQKCELRCCSKEILTIINQKGEKWNFIPYISILNGSECDQLTSSIALSWLLQLKEKMKSSESIKNLVYWLIGSKNPFKKVLLSQVLSIQHNNNSIEFLEFLTKLFKLTKTTFEDSKFSMLSSFIHRQSLDPYAHEKLSWDECVRLEKRNDKALRQHFEPICSRILEYLFLGSKMVSENLVKLRHYRITHILNCAGSDCKNAFPNEFKYTTIYLNDLPSEDISKFFLLVIDLIESVREQNGRILVHCNKGMSRSASLVIAYLMWKRRLSYDEAFAYVKRCRYTIDPNLSFLTQLQLKWKARLNRETTLHRLAPHGLSTAPEFTLPTQEFHRCISRLDPRTVFLLLTPTCNWVWTGSQVESQALLERANELVKQFQRLTGAVSAVAFIKQGEEMSHPAFLSNLDYQKSAPIIRQNHEYDKEYDRSPINSPLASPSFSKQLISDPHSRPIRSDSQLFYDREPTQQSFDDSDPILYRFDPQTNLMKLVMAWDDSDFESRDIYVVDSVSHSALAVWIGSKVSFSRENARILSEAYLKDKARDSTYSVEIVEEENFEEDTKFFNNPIFFI